MNEVKDSAPYYERKNVILCRSGIQEYTAAEVARFGLTNPPVQKDIYKVYRPASVIIGTAELMRNLPITKEHPPEFVDGDNWQRYAHGYTGSEAEVVSLGAGEVGIKSTLVFSTRDVYNYFLDGNEEVSLGYNSRNAWVDNPESLGYDIVMTGIESVNHLAITAAGRGGSRVSVIDSLIGGLAMSFKTGLFHFLKWKGKTTDSATPFSKIVFDSLEESKNLDGAALEKEVTRVMDSIATLKDGESKTLLMDTVTDCYKAIDAARENKEKVSAVLDSLYKKAEDETLKNMDAMKEEPMDDPNSKDSADETDKKVTDEDGKGKGTSNISDADEEKAKEEAEKKKEEGTKDSEEKEKKEVTDSLTNIVDSAIKKNNEALMTLIDQRLKAALGLSNTSSASGGETTDSAPALPADFDISKFVL